ncbi:uncharacterized protein LOC141913719 [Tubulanus polymorphus]|uniref:uncharacterized protein LOC141913719 n=1 Tax=Tubulanus polymorphus TaxID=672921 RepID=UPI003DA4D81C
MDTEQRPYLKHRSTPFLSPFDRQYNAVPPPAMEQPFHSHDAKYFQPQQYAHYNAYHGDHQYSYMNCWPYPQPYPYHQTNYHGYFPHALTLYGNQFVPNKQPYVCVDKFIKVAHPKCVQPHCSCKNENCSSGHLSMKDDLKCDQEPEIVAKSPDSRDRCSPTLSSSDLQHVLDYIHDLDRADGRAVSPPLDVNLLDDLPSPVHDPLLLMDGHHHHHHHHHHRYSSNVYHDESPPMNAIGYLLRDEKSDRVSTMKLNTTISPQKLQLDSIDRKQKPIADRIRSDVLPTPPPSPVSNTGDTKRIPSVEGTLNTETASECYIRDPPIVTRNQSLVSGSKSLSDNAASVQSFGCKRNSGVDIFKNGELPSVVIRPQTSRLGVKIPVCTSLNAIEDRGSRSQVSIDDNMSCSQQDSTRPCINNVRIEPQSQHVKASYQRQSLESSTSRAMKIQPDTAKESCRRRMTAMTAAAASTLSALSRNECGSYESSSTRRAPNTALPAKAVQLMNDWYEKNLQNPYPKRETVINMAEEGNISVNQVRSWFSNKRNRSNNTRAKNHKRKFEERLSSLCHELLNPEKKAAVDSQYVVGELVDLLGKVQGRANVRD